MSGRAPVVRVHKACYYSLLPISARHLRPRILLGVARALLHQRGRLLTSGIKGANAALAAEIAHIGEQAFEMVRVALRAVR